MSKKKTNKDQAIDHPEAQPAVGSGSAADNQPAYVKELLEKGVVVLTGRTPDELAEMIDNIPADVAYYAGGISHYYDTGLFRLQVNLQK